MRRTLHTIGFWSGFLLMVGGVLFFSAAVLAAVVDERNGIPVSGDMWWAMIASIVSMKVGVFLMGVCDDV